jgi:molecular chaperone GrpE
MNKEHDKRCKEEESCCNHHHESGDVNEEMTLLQKAQDEASEYKNKYFLILAELENTRKRLQKEKQEMMKFAAENVLSDFLSPIESMEKVMSFSDQMSQETKNWVYGFKMLFEQLKSVFAENGVHPFESLGEDFNPHLHEAVEVEEIEEGNPGKIVAEFSKGYKCGERVLRPARVKVTKLKVAQAESNL